MNEKKFHKLIESKLTTEELKQKEKTLEKIYSKTGVQPKEKSKSKCFSMLMPIASAIALICIVIPISIFLINSNSRNLTVGSVSNSITYESNSKTEENSKDKSLSGTSINHEDMEIVIPKDCCEGIITFEGDKKYVVSIDGLYRKEILSSVVIEDYHSGLKINIEEISSKNRIFILIVTEENKYNYSAYDVGDIVKLIVA